MPAKLNQKIFIPASEHTPFLVAFGATALCAAGLAFRVGPWQLWMGAEILFVAAIACKSIPAAVAVLIAISPYNSAIRWVADDVAWMRGLRDVMSYAIFAVFCSRYLGRSRTSPYSSVALFFVAWCVLVQIVNSSSLLVDLLGLRQLVQFFLLFPILVTILYDSERKSAEDLLGAIVVTAGVLSVIQFANHFGYINLPLPESEVLLRSFEGEEVPRMIPIWEVSPSGLAIYMVSASLIVIARFAETRAVPVLWAACLAGTLSCAWLTLSHATLLALPLGLGVVAFCARRKAVALIGLGLALLACLPLLFGSSSLTEKNTADYSGTFLAMWQESLSLALQHPIFGTGAAPSGYLAELLEGETHSIGDGGWALLACQIGIPVAAIMLGWAVSLVASATWKLRANTTSQAGSERWVPVASLAAAIAYFVNAHGVPWYRVGADVNFIVLAAILVAFVQPTPFISPKPLRKIRHSRGQATVAPVATAAGTGRSFPAAHPEATR